MGGVGKSALHMLGTNRLSIGLVVHLLCVVDGFGSRFSRAQA
jgi:hypothetical protein